MLDEPDEQRTMTHAPVMAVAAALRGAVRSRALARSSSRRDVKRSEGASMPYAGLDRGPVPQASPPHRICAPRASGVARALVLATSIALLGCVGGAKCPAPSAPATAPESTPPATA